MRIVKIGLGLSLIVLILVFGMLSTTLYRTHLDRLSDVQDHLYTVREQHELLLASLDREREERDVLRTQLVLAEQQMQQRKEEMEARLEAERLEKLRLEEERRREEQRKLEEERRLEAERQAEIAAKAAARRFTRAS